MRRFNDGRLEMRLKIASTWTSPGTIGLYDRREDDVSLDEVERILI
ncbi:MAG TPA: hypothetical protein PLE54_12015 [Burkholderiaceae bacterium]|nr:hypothetical protein [Burkholderiaceae bacterium]